MDQPAQHHRSLKAWLILLGAWGVGLIIWLIYGAAFAFVLFRFLV